MIPHRWNPIAGAGQLYRRRLKVEQEGRCVYCGRRIWWGAKINLCFDGHGIAHDRCSKLGRNY